MYPLTVPKIWWSLPIWTVINISVVIKHRLGIQINWPLLTTVQRQTMVLLKN